MITLEVVSEFVYEHFSGVKTSKNGTHFLAKCSLCGDSKKSKSKRRFNLEYNNGNPIYHCFNCGRSGSFLTLYSTLKGISIPQSLKELQKYDPDYLIQKLSKRKEEKVVKEIEYEYHDYILSDCVSLNQKVNGYVELQLQKALRRFVNNRGITSTKVFMAYKGEYQGRFIIPIYDKDNHIVYFQARASNDKMMPKYKNPTIAKGSIIYNKHKFNKSKYIIVCEGLLDAISVGNQGTSCLGSEISKEFLDELYPLTDKGIIICMDNDETGYNSLLKIINLNNISQFIRFFLFPYKYKECDDINKYATSIKDCNIYEFIVSNSHSKTVTYARIKTESWRLC